MIMNIKIDYLDIGEVSFPEFLAIQSKLVEERKNELIPDTIVIGQFQACYSIGGTVKNIGDDFKSKTLLSQKNGHWHYNDIPIFLASRGGRTTYHDEQQFNIIPIFRLDDLSPSWLIDTIAKISINMLAGLGFKAERKLYDNKFSGISLNNLYVGNIGVLIKLFSVSCFGISLNMNADLNNFNAIYPCGFRDPGVIVGNIMPKNDLSSKKEQIIETLKKECSLIKKNKSPIF